MTEEDVREKISRWKEKYENLLSSTEGRKEREDSFVVFKAGGIDVALCKGCGAEIKFIKTPAGKWMPVNIRPVKVIPDEEGKFYVTSDGRVIKARPAERGEEGSVSAFIPHWATCPKFQNFKKAKK